MVSLARTSGDFFIISQATNPRAIVSGVDQVLFVVVTAVVGIYGLISVISIGPLPGIGVGNVMLIIADFAAVASLKGL